MWLDTADDRTGYEGSPAVVGQLRLDRDGWFNYFGFPEQPMPESPFQFRHSGTNVKALTYGNLGTGGLSRATFEQTLPDDHPSGRFIPGFGTHFVEHRAIDPAGNYSVPESYTRHGAAGRLAGLHHHAHRQPDQRQRRQRRDLPGRTRPSAAT